MNIDINILPLPDPVGQWSKSNAAALIQLLNADLDNNQRSAIKDVLSLLDIMHADVGGDTGSLDALNAMISNVSTNNEIRTSLFGNGTDAGGLVSVILNGGTLANQNPYRSMTAVLDRLGVNHRNAAYHHNHFYLNIRSPASVKIGGNASALTASSGYTEQMNNGFEITEAYDSEQRDNVMNPTALSMISGVILASGIDAWASGIQPIPPAIIEYCEDVGASKESGPGLYGGLTPELTVREYVSISEGKIPVLPDTIAEVRLVKKPDHGSVRFFDGSGGKKGLLYLPAVGFLGIDKFDIESFGEILT